MNQGNYGQYNSFDPGPQRRLYRSRDARFAGVCGGLAEYFDINVRALRLLWVIITFFTGLWPGLITYLIFAMVMKPGPETRPATVEEADFWDQCYSRPDVAMDRIRRRRADLERRLQRLESIVTSPRFDLEQELHKL